VVKKSTKIKNPEVLFSIEQKNKKIYLIETNLTKHLLYLEWI